MIGPRSLPHDHPGAEPPKAEIIQTGRWTYRIIILHGICEYGPDMGGVMLGWTGWGRRHAERKARRELARYRRRLQREDAWKAERREINE